MSLPFIQASSLGSIPGLSHGFTTRHGGVSDGPYASLNLGWATADDDARIEENYDRLAQALKITSDQIVGIRQAHGAKVIDIKPEDSTEELMSQSGDALITALPYRFLSVRVADCYPILGVDPRNRAIAAIHTGWRGTLEAVVSETIKTLQKAYGTDPGELFLAFGPGISLKKFEVSHGVAALFKSNLGLNPKEFKENDGSVHLDLLAINIRLAQEAGVRPDHIWTSGLCTHSDPERFFSYRRDGKRSGRMVGIVGWTS